MAEQPNDASRKSKAEGERFDEEIPNRPATSGLSSGMVNRRRDADDLRPGEILYTPRRYDQPIEDDDDPVMPGNDSTVNTKI